MFYKFIKIIHRHRYFSSTRFAVAVHLLSHVWLFVTSWTAACQASLSFTISQSLLKFTCIELVMLSDHLFFCLPLLLLPSIFPSISVFYNESALRIRWPKYWSFSINPSNEWRRQWQPAPVLLPGKSHGQRSLVGCSPWGREESDTTEQLHFHALEKEMATSVLA